MQNDRHEGRGLLGNGLREHAALAGEEEALASYMAGIALRQRDSLSGLYEAAVSRLYGIAHAVLGSKPDAEDVVCEVFIQVWHNAHHYDPRRGSVKGWLALMTRSRAIDLLRKRRHHESLEDTDESGQWAPGMAAEGPDDFLEKFQRFSKVHRLLAGLSPVQRRLISFAFMQGLCHVEIATLTGMPIGTVKSHIRRALRSMHKRLALPDGGRMSGISESRSSTGL